MRNRDLLANLLRRVDAVYHFAAYQDYLTDFARFTDVNVTSTALIYEIIVAEGLDLSGWWWPRRRRPWARGSTAAPSTASRRPTCGRRRRCDASQWDLTCPVCGGPLEMQRTPERISNPQNAYGMSKYGQEMVAINLGRRYGIPTVAMRYSIVQGPRQSVYNAYSGACRIFNLHYLLGGAPTLYEDGQAIRDYVNIHDVVDANVLVLTDERAVGRVFNVGGGTGVHDRGVRRHRPPPVRLRASRRGSPASTGSVTPGTSSSDIDALEAARLVAAAHARGLGRRVRGVAGGDARAGADPGRGGREDARAGRRAEGRRDEGVPARRGPGHPAAADHRHARRSAWCRSVVGRCSTSGWTRWPRPASTRCW